MRFAGNKADGKMEICENFLATKGKIKHAAEKKYRYGQAGKYMLVSVTKP